MHRALNRSTLSLATKRFKFKYLPPFINPPHHLAAAELRKVLDHPGVGNAGVTGALSILQLARSQALMGDEKAARKSDAEDFLTLWKDADLDLPVFKSAKAQDGGAVASRTEESSPQLKLSCVFEPTISTHDSHVSHDFSST